MMFKEMTDEALKEAYKSERHILHTWSQLAQPRRRDGGASARGTGRALRNVEIIEALARQRGVKL